MQLIYSEDSIPRGSEFQLVHAAYFVALNNDSYSWELLSCHYLFFLPKMKHSIL